MYVKTTIDELREFKIPEMDSIAEFSENNIAQVPKEDGKILVKKDGFSKHKSN